MRIDRRCVKWLLCGALVWACSPSSQEPQERESVDLASPGEMGLWVEEVGPGSASEKAGLKPGDLLLEWSSGDEPARPLGRGDQLRYLEYEKASRRPVRLKVERDGERFDVEMSPVAWRLKAYPTMPEGLLAAYQNAMALESSADRARALAAGADDAQDPLLQIFLYERAANAALDGKEWADSQASFQRAIEIAGDSDLPIWRGVLQMARSKAYRRQGEVEAGLAALDEAVEILTASNTPLFHAQALQRRGELHHRSGDFDAASVEMGKAFEIRRHETPEGLWHGRSLGVLAMLDFEAGRIEEAKRKMRRALRLERAFDAGSITAGTYYSNLAAIAARAGDYTESEALLMRYREIIEARGASSRARASVANNLAIVRAFMGDLEGAELLFAEGIQIKRETTEKTPELVMNLTSLAEVQRMRGAFAAAEKTAEEALHIMENLGEDPVRLAPVLGALGNIARSQDEFAKAASYYDRALKIVQEKNPNGLREAMVLFNQAKLFLEEGDLESAEPRARRALTLLERMAPGSEDVVSARRLLAHISYLQGEMEPAAALYRKALDELDLLARMQGQSDLRQIYFWRKASSFYHEALELEAKLERPGRAYDMLERSRARSFLRLLVDRGLDAAPPELRAELQSLGREYEAKRLQLSKLSPREDPAAMETLRQDLGRLGRDRERLWEKAVASDGILQGFEPLDYGSVQAMLDEKTLLIAFSVGHVSSVLLTVSRDSEPLAYSLPIGASSLDAAIGSWVEDLHGGRRRAGASGLRMDRADRKSRRLYRQIFGQIDEQIMAAERLIILPDGPLHGLPFAALLRDSPDSEEKAYLVELKPFSLALSATQLSALEGRPGSLSSSRFVAFGDPAYEPSPADSELAPATRTLRDLAALRPLPGSRREVEAISRLFAKSEVFLGDDAREAAFRGLGEFDYLHLACHGLANQESPLDSAIAFATEPPESVEGNGLLHAWEIIQDLRFEAELVVLSTCSSASGEAMGGEGIVGLVRAFQAVGARSVVASLWTIEDERAPELMLEFYRGIRSGLPKDQALRKAQLALLASPSGESEAPYYWAGFQLFGGR